MCKYCENIDGDDGINETLIHAYLGLGTIPFANIQVNIWNRKLCLDLECDSDFTTIEEIKIKYCPCCGQNLEEGSD